MAKEHRFTPVSFDPFRDLSVSKGGSLTLQLPGEFLNQYKDLTPDFGPLGWVVSKRTYARVVVEEARVEEWWETIHRVVVGNINLDPRLVGGSASYNVVEELFYEMQETYDYAFWLSSLPPGRGLWMSGTAFAQRTGDSQVNCWFTPVRPYLWAGLLSEDEIGISIRGENVAPLFAEIERVSYPFCFLFDQAMKGGGVGFSVEESNLQAIPSPTSKVDLWFYRDKEDDHNLWMELVGLEKKYGIQRLLTPTNRPGGPFDLVITIPDSREGWVASLQYLIDSHWDLPDGARVLFDLTQIRKRGSKIEGFGGVASGPSPLVELLHNVNSLLNRRQGGRLSSVDATDIQNMIGRCVVAGNVRRCLPEGTLVHTKRGLVPIEEVSVGDEVHTSSGYSEVVDWVYQGEQALLSIKTQLGEFKCTSQHKIAVFDSTGTYTWKQARELVPGDRLVFVDHILEGEETALPNWEYDKPAHSTTIQDITIPELDSDMSWFLGNFHGDGYVYPNFEANGFNAYVSIACSPEYPAIVEKTREQMGRFGVNIGASGPSEADRSIKVRAQSKQMAWYLAQFKKANTSLTVPEFILRGTWDIRAGYLAGLYDADGAVRNRPLVAVASIYPDYLKQVQALYASLGIPTRIRKHRPETEEGWKPLYQLTVVGEKAVRAFEERVAIFSLKYERKNLTYRSQNDFGFPAEFIHSESIRYGNRWNGTSKQMTVATLERVEEKEIHLIPVEVLGVIYNEEIAETYDISVRSAQEFIAGEGLLVHNTAEVALGDFADKDFINMKNYKLVEALGYYDEENNWAYVERTQEQLRTLGYTDEEIETLRGIQWAQANHRWASNNSVIVDDPSFYEREDFAEIVSAIAVNGEPGIFNRYLARNYGRIIDGEQPGIDALVEGANPCIPADTWVMTSEGPRQAIDLLGVPHYALVDGRPFPSYKGMFPTGTQKVFRIITKEGFEVRATGNHLIKSISRQTRKVQEYEWRRTDALQPGDRLKIANHRNVIPWKGEGLFEEGWLLGSMVGDGGYGYDYGAYLRFWGESQESMATIATAYVKEHVGVRADFRGSPKSNERYAYTEIKAAGLTKLADRFEIQPKTKDLGKAVEESSYEFHRGFLRGIFDADGSVQGSTEKGISIRLTQTNLDNLKTVQRMLLRLGIASTIYLNRRSEGTSLLPDGKGGEKLYPTQTVHELVIAKDNLLVFQEVVGFFEPDKKERLSNLLSSYMRGLDRERFAVTVLQVVEDGIEPVYDMTVEEVHEFDANGIVVHNCVEISLAPGEPCNLFEVFPYNIAAKNRGRGHETARAIELAVRYTKRVTFAPYSWKQSAEIIEKNRRLGVSISGFQDWLAYIYPNAIRGWQEDDQGQKWPVYDPDLTQDLDSLYRAAKKADRDYSKEIGCNESIKITTVKPSGTVSLVAGGASPGVHFHYFRYGIRRVKFDKDSDLVPFLQDLGYYVEPAKSEPTSVVVEFPFKAPTADASNFKSCDDVTIEEQFAMQALLQLYWADNMVSCTITFKPEEVPKIGPLLKQYRNVIKATSLLPYSGHGYVQAPYEPFFDDEEKTAKEKYEERLAQIKAGPEEMAMLWRESGGSVLGSLDDSAECVGGACPLR